MVISTSLTNRINNVINVELDLMKKKLTELDFEDDYINDLAKEIISTSKQGKLFRPMLTILIGKMSEQMDENISLNIVNLAVAIELLHTASLVHDDIVDNATQRRGKESFNYVYGNHMAVMMGDMIFAKAGMFVFDTFNIEVMNKFGSTIVDLSMGQLLEMKSRNNIKQSKENYLYRIRKKTASLFETATWSGSVLANMNTNANEKLGQFGMNLGHAFQIFDDIRDFTDLNNKINNSGKNIGIDINNGILTLPVILSLENNSESNPFYNAIKSNEEINVNDLGVYLIHEGFIQQASSIGNMYIQKAINNLKHFKSNEIKNILSDLANSIK
jgi:geranylgeranyl pyrophosphate synthase